MSSSVDGALLNVERCLDAVGETAAAELFARRRLSRADRELRVLVFGEFNRGKSTLINSLLGRIVLPAKLVPTTGHVTRLVGTRHRERVDVRYIGGREDTCPLERLDSLSSLDFDGEARADVASITVHVRSPLLAGGLSLIDVPGVGEQERQTKRAIAAVGEADLVLLVLDARQMLGKLERELAAGWMTERLGKPVTPVVNFMSQIERRDRAELRAILERWSQKLRSALARPWYEVDAMTALKHAVADGPPPQDDFETLRNALALLQGVDRRYVQSATRRAQITAEVRDAAARNDAVLDDLTENAERVAAERAEVRRDLETFERRFAADVSTRRDALAVAARRGFDDRFQQLLDDHVTGKSKEELEAGAVAAYSEALRLAVRDAEKAGEATLLDATCGQLERPEPLTVAEQLMLNVKFHVGDLSDPVTAGAAALTRMLESVLFPIPKLRYAIGAAGAALAGWLGMKEPDYPAAYRASIEEPWRAEAHRISKILLAQFDSRINEMKQQLDHRRQAVGPPLDDELAGRRALQTALDECRLAVESDR